MAASSLDRDPRPMTLGREVGSLLEVVSKIAALVGALAYICGLFVVQTYLQRFGANTLGFFAPQYVAAGIWVVAYLGYFGLLGFVAVAVMKTGAIDEIREELLGYKVPD